MSEPSNETLSQADRERIRREEIFRYEVRKELQREAGSDRSRFLAALNQPFILWLLSTVVVGLLSFSYTKWREGQDAMSASRQFTAEVHREMEYRIRQVDRVLAAAKENGNACLDTLVQTGGKIRGGRIRDYLEISKRITIVSRLGGIFTFPPPNEKGSANVWIGTNVYDYRHIPFKRGFRDSKFANDHLGDLHFLSYSATGRTLDPSKRSEVDAALAEFEDATAYPPKDILEDWFARQQAKGKYEQLYGSLHRVYELDVEDYEDEVRRIHAWISTSDKAWQAVKRAVGT